MKKNILIFCASLSLLLGGCSFKVQQDTFYRPEEKVESIEIQREYVKEDGSSYYCQKVVSDKDEVEDLCEKIRYLKAEKASYEQAYPITEYPIIFILKGAKDHKLILTEEVAFFDQVPYIYTKDGVYSDFLKLYDGMDSPEEETKPNP